MKIQRVWAKKLHGTLTFDVNLSAGINLLVGINGSGKTSVLNIIHWITSLELTTLATTEFDEIGLDILEPNKRKLSIKVTQSDLDLYIHGTIGSTKLDPIHVNLSCLTKDLRNRKARKEEIIDHYRGLTPEKKEEKLWNILKAIAKPLTISLDRKITVSRDEVVYFTDETGSIRQKRTARAQVDPMVQVESIARQRHAQYQSQLIRLNEILKSKVISSTFSTRTGTSTSAGHGKDRVKPITTSKIDAVEKKLLTRMSAWTADPTEQASVKSYFDRIRAIISNIQATTSKNIGAMLSNFLSDDMHRISALSDAFDEFELSAAAAYEPIQIYLKILNSFFADGNRKILFSEQDNQLYFQVNSDATDLRNVDVMSSGERQVLILLTYIAFSPQESGIFVIDEPELSLHPKWQHQLLPSIDELMGENTQMIIATHSPEIVGKYIEKCVEL